MQRAPLPPFDRDTTDPDTGAPLPVVTSLPFAPPALWDEDFMRADLWGLTLPNLPAIPGGASGAAQARMLTYLDYAYAKEDLDRGLKQYGQNGYSHWWRSIPDARDHGGQSVQQYVDMSKRVRDAGIPYVCHFLRSKDTDAPDVNPADVEPYVDALLKANLLSWGCPRWEASIGESPEQDYLLIQHDAMRWPNVRWMVHLQQAYADYGSDGSLHGPSFWAFCLSHGVRRLGYQYKASYDYQDGKLVSGPWSAGMMQARTNDCLTRLVQGGLWGLPATVDFVAFEVVAQLQFNNEADGDGRMADEDIGNVKCYECLCTSGPMHVMGYANGCRRPDGRAL